MKRLLLFDVDGTPVDVAGAGRAALRGAVDRVVRSLAGHDELPGGLAA
jgi:phosphoglycolate phosphatase-like HAD superfamily hydrolase